MPSFSRVMVAEPIYDDVPDRLEVLHEEALRETDPDRDDNEIAAPAIIEVEVLRPIDALAVLLEPGMELTPSRGGPSATFSSSRGNGLADVNGNRLSCLDDARIGLEVAVVVDRVDARAFERFGWWKRSLSLAHERFYDAAGQVPVIKRIVCLHSGLPEGAPGSSSIPAGLSDVNSSSAETSGAARRVPA